MCNGDVILFAGHEAELWEIEQRQLQDRHQLARTQLKETFFLQRSQMLNRHQKVRQFTFLDNVILAKNDNKSGIHSIVAVSIRLS